MKGIDVGKPIQAFKYSFNYKGRRGGPLLKNQRSPGPEFGAS